MGEFLMLAPAKNRSEAASRVKRWTRERFGDVTVLVSELESATPGFPALHTVIAFWTAERKHYHLLPVRSYLIPPRQISGYPEQKVLSGS